MLVAIRHYTHLTAAEWACLAEAVQQQQQQHSSDTATDGHHRCGEGTWTSWSLVDFRYRRHDTLGYLFAVSSFLPLVIILFLSGLASTPAPPSSSSSRRLPALVLLMCLIANTALNTCLKSVLKGPRPPHPSAATSNYSTAHGMPSDHAQFIFFFVTYLSLRARQLGRTATATAAAPLGRKAPAIGWPMRLFFAAAACLVAAGRVYNAYHTVEQVAAGAALGAALAVVATRPPVQRVLRTAAEAAMVPAMLACTRWTRYIA